MSDIYSVFDVRSIYDISDVEQHERENLNKFFKSNYNFEFKDVNSKAFTVQLRNAIMNTCNATDIIVLMARRCLTNKNMETWKEVINYY